MRVRFVCGCDVAATIEQPETESHTLWERRDCKEAAISVDKDSLHVVTKMMYTTDSGQHRRRDMIVAR